MVKLNFNQKKSMSWFRSGNFKIKKKLFGLIDRKRPAVIHMHAAADKRSLVCQISTRQSRKTAFLGGSWEMSTALRSAIFFFLLHPTVTGDSSVVGMLERK